jgi:hypothetical protein
VLRQPNLVHFLHSLWNLQDISSTMSMYEENEHLEKIIAKLQNYRNIDASFKKKWNTLLWCSEKKV